MKRESGKAPPKERVALMVGVQVGGRLSRGHCTPDMSATLGSPIPAQEDRGVQRIVTTQLSTQTIASEATLNLSSKSRAEEGLVEGALVLWNSRGAGFMPLTFAWRFGLNLSNGTYSQR